MGGLFFRVHTTACDAISDFSKKRDKREHASRRGMGFFIPIMRREAIIFRKPEGNRFRDVRRRIETREESKFLLRSSRSET